MRPPKFAILPETLTSETPATSEVPLPVSRTVAVRFIEAVDAPLTSLPVPSSFSSRRAASLPLISTLPLNAVLTGPILTLIRPL